MNRCWLLVEENVIKVTRESVLECIQFECILFPDEFIEHVFQAKLLTGIWSGCGEDSPESQV